MTDLQAYLDKRGITDKQMEQARKRTADMVQAYTLREARKAQNMTQAQVAHEIGVSQNRISRIENGEIGSVSVDTLRRYLNALGLKLNLTIDTPSGTMPLV